jgi:hypothetical protein
VNLADAYLRDDSVCLVLDLCRHTLMHFMTDLRGKGGGRDADEEEEEEGMSGLMFADDVVRPR